MRWHFRTFVAAALAVTGFWLWAERHPEIDAIDPERLPEASQDILDRGDLLATFGGCESCHGADLAGGVRLPTPFGAIFSTNITPDLGTGIGAWSADAFRRAMREGIDRTGRYLYPAFPYDHFTKTNDTDIDAIYAYLISRPPIVRPDTPNELRFPFNIRLAMAGWNLLFLDQGPFVPDPNQDEIWNRGAYLAEGLGHCAACHSPRNAFGARDRARDYSGGDAEGWHSPALTAASPAPIPWLPDALVNYFYDGWDENHGIAAGPMKEVVEHISVLPEDDVAALASYIVSLRADVPSAKKAAAIAFAEKAADIDTVAGSQGSGETFEAGKEVFRVRCQNCHRAGVETVPLALATAVWGPSPHNFLKVVVQGVAPTENAYFVRPMPGFPTLSDLELHDLTVFVREHFSDAPAWSQLETAIAAARR